MFRVNLRTHKYSLPVRINQCDFVMDRKFVYSAEVTEPSNKIHVKVSRIME